ncbi:hypothetical protein [Brevundimonas sp.]|uniref:hypothetical protein n=1 Tax=Brevundimonas sp. TaxID=1871086 RepID=UPI00262F1383|nr:hypothetical protein [Brevundimonas sp.]
MTEPPESSTPAPAEATPPAARTSADIERAERTARLARALRDNLRRRKAVQPKRDRPGN